MRTQGRLALIVFAVLVAFGFTAFAGGVVAVLHGDETASRQAHHHVQPVKPEPLPGPLLSDCPPEGRGLDASVPCSA